MFVIAAVILTAGCATLNSGSSNSEALEAVSLINEGNAETLIGNSSIPFIFESEILFRQGDVDAVWLNLTAGGFTIPGAEVLSLKRVDEQSCLVFAGSEEMRVFFAKYVDPKASVAEIKSGARVYRLLLGKAVDGVPQLLGITGF